MRYPIGVYDRPSDVVLIDSIEIPYNQASRALRRGTQFARWLQDLRPDFGDLWRVTPFD